MAKKNEEAKQQKEDSGITLRAGAVIRNADGVPQKLTQPLVVQVEDRSGRQHILNHPDLLGYWYDVREI